MKIFGSLKTTLLFLFAALFLIALCTGVMPQRTVSAESEQIAAPSEEDDFTWFSGPGAPPADLNRQQGVKAGDRYLDTTSSRIYEFDGLKWKLLEKTPSEAGGNPDDFYGNGSGDGSVALMVGAIVVGVLVLTASIAIPVVFYMKKK